jgi:hypothetical protein
MSPDCGRYRYTRPRPEHGKVNDTISVEVSGYRNVTGRAENSV